VLVDRRGRSSSRCRPCWSRSLPPRSGPGRATRRDRRRLAVGALLDRSRPWPGRWCCSPPGRDGCRFWRGSLETLPASRPWDRPGALAGVFGCRDRCYTIVFEVARWRRACTGLELERAIRVGPGLQPARHL